MFKILEKNDLAASVYKYVIDCPDIARKAKAGQFVIIRLHEQGERIPITIADMDSQKGTITLFVQAIGKTTIQMSKLKSGDSILDVVGPLGEASHIEKFGTVVSIGGGFGIAAIHPIVREYKNAGNKTISIIGARTKDLLLLEEEMTKVSDEVRIATDDGSKGTKGIVTDVLKEMINKNEKIDLVLAIGPLVMMKAVSDVTKPHNIKTMVSMNPIMMDGTGMCGACRVMVGNEMKFACVDGPEFDAHNVDFESLFSRVKMYVSEEKISLEKYQNENDHKCKLEQKIEEVK
jgi:ferredoxin/flavodoxin---NADP+ reductase